MQPFPHPMMYMQVPHGIPPQAPGWPQMMPGPWMTPYMMHPSHQGVQKPVGVMPVARAFSVPDEQIHWNQGSQGLHLLSPSILRASLALQAHLAAHFAQSPNNPKGLET